ncbi:MAG: hypothetical protein E5W75_28400, partial [Mesorhizobium sp.]
MWPRKSRCSRGIEDVFFAREGHAGGTAPLSVLPDISPTWGEIGCHHRFRQFSTSQGRAGRRNRQSPPL